MTQCPTIFMMTLFVSLLSSSASAVSVSFDPASRVSSGPSDPLIVDVLAETTVVNSLMMWIDNTTPPSDTSVLEFTNAEPMTLDVELFFDDYETVEFRLSSSSGSVITRSAVTDDDSFDLVFDMESDLGVSSYLFYFDTGQPGDFTDVFVGNNQEELVLIFGMQFVGEFVPEVPLFTVTGSGTFHPVPEPSAFTLAVLGLLCIGYSPRKLRRIFAR